MALKQMVTNECRLYNAMSGLTGSRLRRSILTSFHRYVLDKPVVTVGGPTQVNRGSSLELSCNADAVPAATAWNWKTPAGPQSGKVLKVSNIQKNGAGTYTCSASNTVSPTTGTGGTRTGTGSKSVTVRYVDTPVLRVSAEIVPENETVTFNCSSVSLPVANLSVIGPDRSILKTALQPSIFYTRRMGCLDRGRYDCQATVSQMPRTSRDLKILDVLCKPREDKRVTTQTRLCRKIGQSAEFKATVIAFPEPSFRWSKREPGSDSLSAIVNENGRFEIKNDNSSSTLTITVQNIEDFTEYSVEVSNREGKTTLNFLLTSRMPPAGVETLTVANVTTDSITVRWVSRYDGGSPQTYFLQYQPMGDATSGSWTEKLDPVLDPGRRKVAYATINDIHPGRMYQVRVYSKNAFGNSPFSSNITATTSELPSQLHYGIGIVIGILIAVAVGAIIVGVLFFWRRRNAKKDINSGNNQNQAGSQDGPVTPGAQSYASLDGLREKPSNYDSFNHKNPVYQNMNLANTDGPTSPDVYENYKPGESETAPELHANTLHGTDNRAYENTELKTTPNPNKTASTKEELYANS